MDLEQLRQAALRSKKGGAGKEENGLEEGEIVGSPGREAGEVVQREATPPPPPKKRRRRPPVAAEASFAWPAAPLAGPGPASASRADALQALSDLWAAGYGPDFVVRDGGVAPAVVQSLVQEMAGNGLPHGAAAPPRARQQHAMPLSAAVPQDCYIELSEEEWEGGQSGDGKERDTGKTAKVNGHSSVEARLSKLRETERAIMAIKDRIRAAEELTKHKAEKPDAQRASINEMNHEVEQLMRRARAEMTGVLVSHNSDVPGAPVYNDPGRPPEQSEPIASTETPEQIEPAAPAEPAESAEPAEPAEPKEAAEPVESAGPTEATEPAESAEPGSTGVNDTPDTDSKPGASSEVHSSSEHIGEEDRLSDVEHSSGLEPCKADGVSMADDTDGNSEFDAYETPLKSLQRFRFSPWYLQYAKNGGYVSTTWSNRLGVDQTLCKFETQGGKCNDAGCEQLHFKDIYMNGKVEDLALASRAMRALHDPLALLAKRIDGDDVLVDLCRQGISANKEDNKAYFEALRKDLAQIAVKKVKGVTPVLDAVTAFRRRYCETHGFSLYVT